MTIASAFNDIAVAQGGTAAKSGAITAAIDALNDALAGSDQPQAKTIEQAVRLLGEHIGGGGGGGTEYNIKCYQTGATPSDPFVELDPCAYIGEWDSQSGHFVPTGEPVTKAKSGEIIVIKVQGHSDVDGIFAVLSSPDLATAETYMKAMQTTSQCPMPAADACFVVFPS